MNEIIKLETNPFAILKKIPKRYIVTPASTEYIATSLIQIINNTESKNN